MTEIEINITIAEARGWIWRHTPSSQIQIDKWGQLVPPTAPRWARWKDGTVSNRMLHFPHIVATARQRAEAFLRTIGKWKE